jgi:hypothetical protein
VADVSRKSDRELRKIVTRADQVVKALPGADEAVRSGRARALLDEAHEALGDAKVARTELTRRKEEASLVDAPFKHLALVHRWYEREPGATQTQASAPRLRNCTIAGAAARLLPARLVLARPRCADKRRATPPTIPVVYVGRERPMADGVMT